MGWLDASCTRPVCRMKQTLFRTSRLVCAIRTAGWLLNSRAKIRDSTGFSLRNPPRTLQAERELWRYSPLEASRPMKTKISVMSVLLLLTCWLVAQSTHGSVLSANLLTPEMEQAGSAGSAGSTAGSNAGQSGTGSASHSGQTPGTTANPGQNSTPGSTTPNSGTASPTPGTASPTPGTASPNPGTTTTPGNTTTPGTSPETQAPPQGSNPNSTSPGTTNPPPDTTSPSTVPPADNSKPPQAK
jgi:hypothetical protein